MKKIFIITLIMIMMLNTAGVLAEDREISGKRVFIIDISAQKGIVTVKTANTLESSTVVTLTVLSEDGNNIYTGSASAGALSTTRFTFEADEEGVYKISAKNSLGEEACRDWVYMDYSYTDSVDRKFEYLIKRGIMEPTDSGTFNLRNTFTMVTGNEPHDSRLLRELSTRTFLNYVCNLTGNYGFTGKYSAEAVNIAKQEGLVDASDDTLYRYLAYEEAMTILVKAMGYTTGKTREEYISIAENLGLADRVSARNGERIKTFDAITLLFNAADVLDNLEKTKSEYIFMPRFYNSNMDRISEFTEELMGSRVSVRAVVSSDGKNANPAVLLACLYDKNNKLIGVSQSMEVVSVENVAEIVECAIDVPEAETPEGYVIRAYFWQSMNSMLPICDMTELSNSR